MTEYRIHGPPGCAKTTQLKESVTRAAKSFTSSGVLVTAFSKTAAQELVQRGMPVDRENVGTLHAICYRGLDRPTIAETCLDLWNKENPIYPIEGGKNHGEDIELVDQANEDTTGGALLLQSTTLRNRMVPQDRWPSDVRMFHDRWSAWKAHNEFLDFTDLLEVAMQRLDEAPSRPDAMFVDEAQDLSPLEIALARKWGQRMRYYTLCGDSDQCIYAFRGATPRSFLEPAIPDDRNRLLTQSYRVSHAVHSLAQRVIQRCKYRFPVAYSPTPERGEVKRAYYSMASATDLLCDVAKDLEAGRRVMVLATCAYMLTPFLSACRSAGVPFHNPYRTARSEWNPLKRGPERVRALCVPLPLADGGDGVQPTYMDLWKALEHIGAKGVLAHGAKARLRSSASLWGDVAVSDEYWRDLFEPKAWEEMQAAMRAGTRVLLEWYTHRVGANTYSLQYACRVARRMGIESLKEPPSLVVGTIHSVKGAEADVVYLSPDVSTQGFASFQNFPESLDFGARLFYVGVTRARTKVVLLEGSDYRAWEF